MKFLRMPIYLHIGITLYMLFQDFVKFPQNIESNIVLILLIWASFNIIFGFTSAIIFFIKNKKNWKMIVKIIIVLTLITAPFNIEMYHGNLFTIFTLISLLMSFVILFIVNKWK